MMHFLFFVCILNSAAILILWHDALVLDKNIASLNNRFDALIKMDAAQADKKP